MSFIVNAADLRAYLQGRAGDLVTAGEAAETLHARPDDADFALRMLAAGFAGTTGLTRRQGGWVYWPDDKET